MAYKGEGEGWVKVVEAGASRGKASTMRSGQRSTRPVSRTARRSS